MVVGIVSWAGLTPKHRESDTTVRRGPITKQGSGLIRWAGGRSRAEDPRLSRLARLVEGPDRGTSPP